jgi:hypothetical protein
MRLPKNRRMPPARRGERRSCFRQCPWVDRRTISRRSAGAIPATASIGMTTQRRPHPWTTTSSWGRPVSGWARTSSRTPTGCWASSSTRNWGACVSHQPGEPTVCSASTTGRSRHLCRWGREWPPGGEVACIASVWWGLELVRSADHLFRLPLGGAPRRWVVACRFASVESPSCWQAVDWERSRRAGSTAATGTPSRSPS